MPRKQIVTVGSAKPNPNLSAAVRFGNLVFVSGQTGRHPKTGEVGKDIREQTRNTLERIKEVLTAAGTSMDQVLSAMVRWGKRYVPGTRTLKESASAGPTGAAGPTSKRRTK